MTDRKNCIPADTLDLIPEGTFDRHKLVVMKEEADHLLEGIIRFRLRPEQLAFWNADMEKVVEPGGFTVWAGPDSGTGLQGRFEL